MYGYRSKRTSWTSPKEITGWPHHRRHRCWQRSPSQEWPKSIHLEQYITNWWTLTIVLEPFTQVAVYYEGRLQKNNKKFDASKKGPGFKFHLGAGEVIKGWDAGVVGMKIGGKRRLTVPAHMAYGKGGSPPVIPPNSTLVFDVELKGINWNCWTHSSS